ncbi:MAG: hypothetical protein QOH97_1615 [Actinoplanes sp.]|nr:hypothetical protein [Actinoplanes sp.]
MRIWPGGVRGALIQPLVRSDRAVAPAAAVGDQGLLDCFGQVRPQMPAVADLDCLGNSGADRLKW